MKEIRLGAGEEEENKQKQIKQKMKNEDTKDSKVHISWDLCWDVFLWHKSVLSFSWTRHLSVQFGNYILKLYKSPMCTEGNTRIKYWLFSVCLNWHQNVTRTPESQHQVRLNSGLHDILSYSPSVISQVLILSRNGIKYSFIWGMITHLVCDSSYPCLLQNQGLQFAVG